jgi:hypothetical protein
MEWMNTWASTSKGAPQRFRGVPFDQLPPLPRPALVPTQAHCPPPGYIGNVPYPPFPIVPHPSVIDPITGLDPHSSRFREIQEERRKVLMHRMGELQEARSRLEASDSASAAQVAAPVAPAAAAPAAPVAPAAAAPAAAAPAASVAAAAPAAAAPAASVAPASPPAEPEEDAALAALIALGASSPHSELSYTSDQRMGYGVPSSQPDVDSPARSTATYFSDDADISPAAAPVAAAGLWQTATPPPPAASVAAPVAPASVAAAAPAAAAPASVAAQVVAPTGAQM